MSIGSPSCWSVVVAAATDVAVPDGLGVGGSVGQEGLVEAGLEDRSDRPIARCANADPTATCGFEALRPIGLLHPQNAETGSEALLGMGLCPHDRLAQRDRGRAGVQKAYRRCALGMCSGIVVCGASCPSARGSRCGCRDGTPRWW